MGPEERLERLYAEHADAVLRYLRRRVAPDVADDALSSTFVVAWRRLDHVPPGDAARAWLLAVARRLLANERRAAGRRIRLLERLRSEAPPTEAVAADPQLDTALASLSSAHREILLLTAWDGLTPTEAATVLRCTPLAARSRLHRARRSLRTALEQADEPAGLMHPRTLDREVHHEAC